MNKEKLSWEEMVATEPELVGVNSDIIEKIVKRAIEEERERIKSLIFEHKYCIDYHVINGKIATCLDIVLYKLGERK